MSHRAFRPLARACLAACVASAMVAGVVVAVGGSTIGGAGDVSVAAERGRELPGDIAVAYDIGPVDQAVIDASAAAATRAGGSSTTTRGGSVGLRRIVRGGTTVHAPPSGYLIPMVFTAIPSQAVRGVYGGDVALGIGPGQVVLNQITADLTGAAAGDRLDLRANNGSTVSLTIAAVLPDEVVGGSEIVMETATAERLGFSSDTATAMWGFDRDRFVAEIDRFGLNERRDTRVSYSWSPPNPDSTLTTATTKSLIGEPWYRVTSTGSLAMHPTWEATNLTDGLVTLEPTLGVRARCNVAIVGALSAALADVVAAGLGSEIDVANTNRYGGCYNPRYSRTSGYLSRHAYAIAFDMNTETNCMGCVPVLDCEVVDIFRSHGFAWGGNFRRADGMHMEWVGEPRDQIEYPSRYCPNIVDDPSPAVSDRFILLEGAQYTESHEGHDH